MKYSFIDFISGFAYTWNSKQMLLSRGLDSIIAGITL